MNARVHSADVNVGSVGDVLLRIETGKSVKTQERPARSDELGILKLSAVTWGEFRPGENKAVLEGYSPGKCPRPMDGDLLISRANTRELVGAPVLVRGNHPQLLLSDKILRLVPNLNRVEPRYLVLALRSAAARAHFESRAGGTSGSMTNITQDDIRSAPVSLPPLDEQRRIAEVLDRAEALRAKRRAARAQLDTLTQSIFLDLMAERGSKSDTIALDAATEAIIDYRGKSPKKTARGIPLVTARVVKGGVLLEPNEFIAEDDYSSWMRRGLPEAGDVLFTTEAPLGEVAQLDHRQVALAQRLLLLRGRKDILNNTFLMHALTSKEVRDQIFARSTGSTVRGIRQKELRKVRIPIPPLTLQQDFAQRIVAVEKLKAAQRRSLAELDALFASLQHRAFRGEL